MLGKWFYGTAANFEGSDAMSAINKREEARLRALIARAKVALSKAEGTIERAKERIARAEEKIAYLDRNK